MTSSWALGTICIGSPDVSRMAGPGPSYHQKAWLFWPLRSFLLRLAKGFVSSNRSGLACGAAFLQKNVVQHQFTDAFRQGSVWIEATFAVQNYFACHAKTNQDPRPISEINSTRRQDGSEEAATASGT